MELTLQRLVYRDGCFISASIIYDVEMKRILWMCLCVFIDVLATIACLMVALFYKDAWLILSN